MNEKLSISRGALLCLFLIFLIQGLPLLLQAQSYKIMPLGNSITEGTDMYPGYRYDLYQRLEEAYIDFSYVGTKTSFFRHRFDPGGSSPFICSEGPTYAPPLAHEGHRGWRADEIINGKQDAASEGKLADWLQAYTPDVVLMHIGTNDMLQNQSVTETIEELREIVRILRQDNPEVIILMAKLFPAHAPTVGITAANNIILLNNNIPVLAQELNSTTSPVVLVDQNTGFDPTPDSYTYDGIHPNWRGAYWMMRKWYDALRGILVPYTTAPAVSITAPDNGTVHKPGQPVTISAEAWDREEGVARVEFYVDCRKIGEDSTRPYELSWTPTLTGHYTLSAEAIDTVGARDGSHLVSIDVAEVITGKITREYWAKVEGSTVSSIPVSTTPTSVTELTRFEAPSNVAENYGQRVRGYLTAPASGEYTFWIASDDHSEFWLSSSADPASKVKLAFVEGWTKLQEWDKYPSQQSVKVRLELGQRYYIEALHKEGWGGDNLAVGWQLPDGKMERPIPGNRLTPYEEGSPPPPANTYTLTVSVIGSGSVSPSEGTFLEDEIVALKATPAAGYTFSGWSGDVFGGNNPQNVLMDRNKSAIATFTSTKLSQTITFNPLPGRTYGDAPFTLSATASSGLPVNFSVVSGPATLSDSTATITGAGTIVIRASQAGNDLYEAAVPVEQSLIVEKAPQVIHFQELPNKTYGDPPFNLSATASSGLPVHFSIVSGPATISGVTVTLTGAGTVVVKATQSGNENYNAATPVEQSFEATSAPVATGGIDWEYFWNPPATADLPSGGSDILAGLTPDGSRTLTTFATPRSHGNLYASRARGYVTAPVSGEYIFYLAGDDKAELWLSADENPLNKSLIASLYSYSSPSQYDKYASQTSAKVYLVAGQRYYIEAVHRENWGEDHLAVGWQLPDGALERPIPGSRLSPYSDGTTPPPNLIPKADAGADRTITLPTNSVSLAGSGSDSDGTVSSYSWSQVSGPSATLSGASSATLTASNLLQGTYVFRLTVTDDDRATATDDATVTVNPAPSSSPIVREVWSNVSGLSVTAIPVNTPPTSTSQLILFEAPSNAGYNYGARVRAYVHPPATGNYIFWIASDDQSELWLSTDENPANKQKIASVTGYTGSRQWGKYTSQASVAITLHAGQKYYIEALHKEAWGDDNLAVGWQLPDGVLERPVPGNRLSAYIPSQEATAQLITAGGSEAAGPLLDYYPNPFTENITLRLLGSKEDRYSMKLYDVSGREVWQAADVPADNTLTIGRELNAGIYILMMHTGKEARQYKLVKAQ
ncbi:PA14 domain-containing protein [Pontibacter toksunensis]|uniref:PA14 domain-containing protein n=1 Tax=Pontibacter toksunensis TaxID=1332631 RepID=A0ABW6C5I7_9BACT